MPAGDTVAPADDASPPAWTWGAAAIGAHVARRLGVAVTGEPVRLAGGLLNVVWRVPVDGLGGLAGDASVIVKAAPPFVASAPDVPLPASRLRAEARALAALPSRLDPSPRGGVAGAAGDGGGSPRGGVPRSGTEGVRSTDSVCTPRRLDFDADASVLVMSDAGDLPPLGTWLASASPAASPDAAADALARLGAFVGRLHGATLHAPDLADWHQPEIAAVRLGVQYRTVEARLAGVADAAALGAIAADLGERWLAPGRCVVMGDLWPPSVLVGEGGALTVIDWELCTAGEPAQDLGHLAAHLWLLGRMDLWAPFVGGWRRGASAPSTGSGTAPSTGSGTAPSTGSGTAPSTGSGTAPSTGSGTAPGQAAVGALLAGGTADDAVRHAACELLARVAGPFGAERTDAASVVETAASWLRAPGTVAWATGLRA